MNEKYRALAAVMMDEYAVSELRDESAEGWHEDAESCAIYRMIPVARLRLRITAHAEDQTEDGERCRASGWDYLAESVVEEVSGE